MFINSNINYLFLAISGFVAFSATAIISPISVFVADITILVVFTKLIYDVSSAVYDDQEHDNQEHDNQESDDQESDDQESDNPDILQFTKCNSALVSTEVINTTDTHQQIKLTFLCGGTRIKTIVLKNGFEIPLAA
jgi:hypothetical protein